MDVREKLVELVHTIYNDPRMEFHDLYEMNQEADTIAEIMIENGVTVQEWISVNENLPKPGEDALVVVFDGYDTYTDTDCLMRDGKWCYETENHKVTHWQQMPQPPKGE